MTERRTSSAKLLPCEVLARRTPGKVEEGDRVMCYAFEGEGWISGPHEAVVLEVYRSQNLMHVRWVDSWSVKLPTGRSDECSGLSVEGNGPAFSTAPLRGARRIRT